MDKFFIAGLQRTGTNYVQKLFNENIECNVNCQDIYWKHQIVFPESAYLEKMNIKAVILIVKNPYSWIESICFRDSVDIHDIYSIDYGMNDKETMYLINNEKTFNIKSLINLYTTFYNNWLINCTYEKFFIKYEDLLNKPNDIINDFTKKYNLKLSKNEITSQIKDVFQSDMWDVSLLEMYKNNRLRHLEAKHIEHINMYLDDSFLNKLEYYKY